MGVRNFDYVLAVLPIAFGAIAALIVRRYRGNAIKTSFVRAGLLYSTVLWFWLTVARINMIRLGG